ncbi:acetyl-CoA synthetase-like protein [Clavulina sp. PMI_390]|nr:acetyl-CoA synthetase-like protein [Clavulina sp. PMI_390]
MAAPPFHILGMFLQLFVPLASGVTIVLWELAPEGCPTPVSTADNTLRAIEASGCDATFVVPSFATQWSHNEEDVRILAKLDRVITGSGPLSDEIGEHLVNHGVKLTTAYGGTEFLAPCIVDYTKNRGPHEWAWTEIAPEFPVRWDPQGDDTFELQVLTNEHYRPMVINTETPDGPAFSTKDLFIKHPTKQGLWKIVGRLDDQVTLGTGEKVNPNSIELAVLESPLVTGALLVGRGRNQVGLLLEIVPEEDFDSTDDDSLARIRNLIWPIIEKINAKTPTFARIYKETIIPSRHSKPFPRTPKGSIQRKQVEAVYEVEIQRMYAAIDEARGGEVVNLPKAWDRTSLEIWLVDMAKSLMQQPEIDISKDLFEQGADSLIATFLRVRVVSAMRECGEPNISTVSADVDPSIVFTHPTIAALAKYLTDLVLPDAGSAESARNLADVRIRDMMTLIEKYTSDLGSQPIPSENSHSFRPPKETIVITGTTGTLGSYLLAQVLQDEKVERVWAINRSKLDDPLATRQQVSFEEKGLSGELLQHEKLRLVESDLGEPRLGLTESLYQEIANTTTLIINNAWRLDFNLSVSSFEPHIRATRNLVNLALASPHGAGFVRTIFISSISALASWPLQNGPVPEGLIEDPAFSVGSGYGESKYVGEKILDIAAKKTGLEYTVIRLGQLSGGNNGFWSSNEWVPNLLQSSAQLGYLPDAQRSILWVPHHSAADAILDVSLQKSSKGSTPGESSLPPALHLVHPRPVPWSTLMKCISTTLADTCGIEPLPLIPWTDWVAKLESAEQTIMQTPSSASNPRAYERIPGIKLIRFYRTFGMGMSSTDPDAQPPLPESERGVAALEFETTKMQSLSPTLDKLDPLNDDDVLKWIEYWRSKGMFTSPASHP